MKERANNLTHHSVIWCNKEDCGDPNIPFIEVNKESTYKLKFTDAEITYTEIMESLICAEIEGVFELDAVTDLLNEKDEKIRELKERLELMEERNA